MNEKNGTIPAEQVYRELMVACKNRDIPTVERCIKQIMEILSLNTAAFGYKLGVSDQTVYRWLNHKAPGYTKSIPKRIILDRIGELLGVKKKDKIVIPRNVPSIYFKAVAECKNPRIDLLETLIAAENALGGKTLSEEACKAILKEFESREE